VNKVEIGDLFAFILAINHCADNCDSNHENNNNDHDNLNGDLGLSVRIWGGRLCRYHLLLFLSLDDNWSCLDDWSSYNSLSRSSLLGEYVILSSRITTWSNNLTIGGSIENRCSKDASIVLSNESVQLSRNSRESSVRTWVACRSSNLVVDDDWTFVNCNCLDLIRLDTQSSSDSIREGHNTAISVEFLQSPLESYVAKNCVDWNNLNGTACCQPELEVILDSYESVFTTSLVACYHWLSSGYTIPGCVRYCLSINLDLVRASVVAWAPIGNMD